MTPNPHLTALGYALQELQAITLAHPPLHSAHEGYAVILEELDELWDEVRKRPAKRNPSRMRTEAIHVAATALRFAADITPSPPTPRKEPPCPTY